jgi:hypothetical protein
MSAWMLGSSDQDAAWRIVRIVACDCDLRFPR